MQQDLYWCRMSKNGQSGRRRRSRWWMIEVIGKTPANCYFYSPLYSILHTLYCIMYTLYYLTHTLRTAWCILFTWIPEIYRNPNNRTIIVFITSAKSIFLRFVSKARRQRAVEPEKLNENVTYNDLEIKMK